MRKWLVIWVLIYGTFLIGDFIAPGVWQVTLVKLVGLFLCFVYACNKSPRDHLLKIAIALTILSDVILALNNVNKWGVFTFCFAHFFHMARLAGTSPKFFVVYASFVVLTTVFGILVGLEPMFILGFVYGVSLLSNVWLSARWWRREPKNLQARCAYGGFLLFLACDIAVGVSYLSFIGVLPLLIKPVADYLAWLFYYPSQVLIANSSKISEKS